jgi:glycosyltransferase involved in cell wall biosynthesis
MARALARRGHDVTVLCYAHGVGVADPEYRVLRTPRVPLYSSMRAGPDLVKPGLDMAMAAMLMGLEADVVHAHNYEAPIAAAMSRLRTGIPLVYSAHNTMEEELPVYFSRPLVKRLARRAGRMLDRSVPRLADHAIAIRPETTEKLLGFGCGNVSHVPPGVEPSDFHGSTPAQVPPGPWVVYAGNPDPYQDLDILMSAMKRLPHVGLIMVSASDMSAWSGWGLKKFLPIQTGDFEVVRSFLAAADLAVLPRTVCSGFPIKLLNYLGMGLPVVAAEGAADGMPGLVSVRNRDPADMALAIQRLLGDKPLAERLGNEGRRHVLRHCTWDARAEKLEKIYHKLCVCSQ